jgi:hypothetical protein
VSLVRTVDSGAFISATNALFALGTEALPVVVKHVKQPAPPHIRWYAKSRAQLPKSIDDYLATELIKRARMQLGLPLPDAPALPRGFPQGATFIEVVP